MAFVIGLYEQQPVKKCPRPGCQTREFSTLATGGRRWYPFLYPEFPIVKLTLIVLHAASGSISLGPNFPGHSDFPLRKTYSNRSVPRGNGSRMCGSSQANCPVCLSELVNLDSLRKVPTQQAFFHCKSPIAASWQAARRTLVHTEPSNLYHLSIGSMSHKRLQSKPSKLLRRSAG